ncbi:MAG: hypothetical protein WKF97_14395 [Chitinophagaceae bacterium]
MTRQKEIRLGFWVDKLTNSIENTISGEVFDTAITLLTQKDSKQIKKKHGAFDWHIELRQQDRQVYKLSAVQNPTIIQGLISLTDKGDHIFMDLIENAYFNKGKKKLYSGVAGNLVALGCKLSFERGYEGIVSFIAKTQLIEHYKQTLGAKLFAGNRMFIDTKEALTLVSKYFKDFDYGKFLRKWMRKTLSSKIVL